MKKGVDYIGVAAGGMILNDKGELFLAKRSQSAKNERGHWEIPGGSVNFGETLEAASRREILEEFAVSGWSDAKDDGAVEIRCHWMVRLG